MHFLPNPQRAPHINNLIHAQYHNSHFHNQPKKSPIIKKKNNENLMCSSEHYRNSLSNIDFLGFTLSYKALVTEL